MLLLIQKLCLVIFKIALIYQMFRIATIGILTLYDWIILITLRLKTLIKKDSNIKPCCCYTGNDPRKLQAAIENNHVRCLKIAFENGCEWTSEICDTLGALNHKEALYFAHLNGCDWDYCTCSEENYDVKKCVENGLYRTHTLPFIVA